MESRSRTSCDIKCEPCTGDRYTKVYNVDMSCNVCDTCNKPNFETKTNCTSTSNTVCRCKTGFKCKDKSCSKCVPIPTPTPIRTTLPPATTAISRAPVKPNKETVWFLVIIALLCAAIGVVVLTKLKRVLHCIMSNHGYFMAEKTSTETSSTEDEDVSKPVQEVCGKCDQPIDV
ncbi:tumor necrosis factor receptor superfamily member 6 [Austrofundulus limnaeus]|uniref:Tumor necrosis factor receptor superfamily member 6 n=1 Tax=Austrofundulus limnaeus TaxID=52670 RepID=A0A2I4BJX9_AUSLI|nr:PREDICTED: CD27 antigen [Austrofundulus limnaeus]